MPSGNRVEELESKVKELQATVDGLTDELMECKERVRAIENEVEPDMEIIEGGPGASVENALDDDEPSADTDNTGAAEEGEDADSESEDIIVA